MSQNEIDVDTPVMVLEFPQVAKTLVVGERLQQQTSEPVSKEDFYRPTTGLY